MKRQTFYKRFLSVILSITLIVGVITISVPNQVNANATENLIANGVFDSTTNWTDNSDSANPVAVPNQQQVQDAKVTEYIENGDFESGNTELWGSVHNLPIGIVEENNNKVLKVSEVTNGKVFHVLSGLMAGETYQISFDIKGSSNISFHLFCGDEGLSHADPFYTWQTATTTWTTHEMSYTVPAGNAGHLVFQCVGGSGELYIDNFSVSQQEITTTEVMKPVFAADFEQDSDVNKVLANPGAWGITTDDKMSGTKSLKLDFTVAWNQFGIGTFDLKAGTTYTISYDWKIQNLSGTPNAYSRLVKSSDIWTGLVLSSFQTGATDWTNVSYTYTPTENITAAIYMEVGGVTGTMYVDNLSVSCSVSEPAYTYTEGIGNCLGAEPDNVLVMEKMTEVTYPVTITNGTTYEYSFVMKNDAMGSDFSFGFGAGENAIFSGTESVADWTVVSGTFTATADATSIKFTRTGTGKAFVDDIVLKEYEESAPGPIVYPTVELDFKFVEVDNSWYFTASNMSNITGNYYKITVNVDETVLEVPIEKTADGFVIWSNFFGLIDTTGSVPSAKLEIPADTLLQQIDPNTTGWSTVVEDGQTLKVAEDLVVTKTEEGWKVEGEQGPTEPVEPVETITVSLGNAMGIYNAGTENEVFSANISSPEEVKTMNMTVTGLLNADGNDRESVIAFPGNGEIFFYLDGATEKLIINKDTEFLSGDGKTIVKFDKNYEIDLLNQVIYEQGNKPTEKEPLDLELAYDRLVGESFMFAWSMSTDSKPEASYYRIDAIIDGKETQVLIEYYPGDNAFFIYSNCFNGVPVESKEGYPVESFELKEGTELTPVVTGTWVKNISGQPYKLTKGISVVKEGTTWMDADYADEISKLEPMEVKVVFERVQNGAAVLTVITPDGKSIDSTYGDWTTAWGTILRGVLDAETKKCTYTSEKAAYSITGSTFYISGLRLNELDGLQIDKGTILYPDATCKSIQPIKIMNQFRIVRDANDEWEVDKTFTTDYNLTSSSNNASENAGTTDKTETVESVVQEEVEEIVSGEAENEDYSPTNIRYHEEDDDVSQTDKTTSGDYTSWIIIASVGTLLVVLGIIILLALRRRKKEQQEEN